MKVKAPQGLKCPKEGKPREYITDDEKGVDVPDSSRYYRKLVIEGSLLVVSEAAGKAASRKSEKEGGK